MLVPGCHFQELYAFIDVAEPHEVTALEYLLNESASLFLLSGAVPGKVFCSTWESPWSAKSWLPLALWSCKSFLLNACSL